MNFKSKVLTVVVKIPKGSTMSYKEMATFSGNSKAFRAVGSIMKRNQDKRIPCHRVVRSDGQIGGYNRGGKIKRAILAKERQ